MNQTQEVWIVQHFIGFINPKWLEYYNKECRGIEGSFVDIFDIFESDESVNYIDTHVFYDKKTAEKMIDDMAFIYTNDQWNNLSLNFVGVDNKKESKTLIWVEPSRLTMMFDLYKAPIM